MYVPLFFNNNVTLLLAIQFQLKLSKTDSTLQICYACGPMVGVTLIARHRRACRKWATEHVNWTRNEWHIIIFLLVFLQENVRFGGWGVMVYAGTSTNERTDLHVIQNGALIGRRCKDEILKSIVLHSLTLQQLQITSCKWTTTAKHIILTWQMTSSPWKESYKCNGQRIL